MWSPFYGYYYIKTPTIYDSMETKVVENYLEGISGIIKNAEGSYSFDGEFLSLQLMNVKNFDSWSSNDYSREKVNYIAIVTSKRTDNPKIMDMLLGFARHLQLPLEEED